MSRLTLPRAFLAVAAIGFVLMIGFDATITRLLGVACIFGALALGVAAIATPEFLEEDLDESEGEGGGSDSNEGGSAGEDGRRT
ncbi:hypothetical protein BH10ACT11_BH10ACT11_08470 [soil metagenome]